MEQKKSNKGSDTSEAHGFMVLEDNKIVDCNARVQEIFGCSTENDLVGRKFFELAYEFQDKDKTSLDLYKEKIDEAQAKGKSSFKYKFRKVNGMPIIKTVMLIARLSEGKEVMHVVIKDTELSNEEESFENEASELYSSIFNNNHTPMLLIDSKSGEIKDANLAACKYYGYTLHQLRQLNISDINTLSKDEISLQMEKAKGENRNYFEFSHRMANGEIRPVEVYSGPITVKGRTMLLSIIHDVKYKKEIEQKVKINESYFKSLYEYSPEAIAVLDNEFKIISINSSFERIFQYSIEDVKDQNITRILCEETQYDESTYIKDSITKGEFVRQETKRIKKDGSYVDVSFLGYPIISDGEQIGVYAVYSDLSRVKETESKTRLFAEIFKNNTVGVVITDIEGNIQWVNDAFSNITGYALEEIEGKKPSILKSGKHSIEYYSNMWNSILNAGKWQGEISNIRKSGEIYQEWLSIIAIRDDNGKIERFVGMISDITDAKKKENIIEILTNRDGLTDLFNRDYFVNRLNYEINKRNKESENKQELAIIFLDIDDFKEINDTLGHLVGDSILKEFAFRLKESIRDYDIAARFGGDEFIVALLTIKEDYELISVANRIVSETKKPFLIDNIELHITASLGISRYPKDGKDSTSLIRNADIAMYRSKELKSKKITMFEPSLDEKVREYFTIKNNLRNAIANEEFFLEYQPIIDAKQDNIIGVEALLRWRAGGGELISPGRFIPVAEKAGYMQAIGEWVIRTACIQNKAWQRDGYNPIYVSVNVSIMELEQHNFYEVVKGALKESGLHPQYLQLEITETIFTKNYDLIVNTIKRINTLGVKIAIDDFGTGYSSLGQLSRLDITKLKIDKSFINEINENLNKNKIVKTIISLAESLNLELVAEGVETKEQLDFLMKNDCNVVQGFLFSKPLGLDLIEKLFAKDSIY